MKNILESGFAEMGISVHEKAIERFLLYYAELSEKNKVMNLTAIDGEEDTARLHFLDSTAPLKFESFSGKKVIDVGTGAGFPGLPLKIACPDMEITLLDSLNKRLVFLEEVCSKCGLEGVSIVHGRAEEPGDMRESFDIAVSRAVAGLNVLAEFCLPYVKKGGKLIALKGPKGPEELKEAEKAIKLLGGSAREIIPYDIPGAETGHNLIVIDKIAQTPAKYPRKFAQIKKSPL